MCNQSSRIRFLRLLLKILPLTIYIFPWKIFLYFIKAIIPVKILFFTFLPLGFGFLFSFLYPCSIPPSHSPLPLILKTSHKIILNFIETIFSNNSRFLKLKCTVFPRSRTSFLLFSLFHFFQIDSASFHIYR